MPEPLVLHSRVLLALVAHVESRGFDPSGILAEAGLSTPLEAPPLVELTQLRRLGDALAEAIDDPFLGLHAAMGIPRGAFGVLEYVARSTATVQSLVREVSRFGALVSPHMSFDFDASIGLVSQTIPGEPLCLGRQGNECAVAQQLRVLREAASVAIVPERAAFAHPRPRGDISPLEAFLGTTMIAFDAGHNGFVVPADVFDAPLVSADEALCSILTEKAESLVATTSEVDDLASVRRTVASLLDSGEPTASRVARVLGTSARTLHRRLAAKETSLRTIVDAVRRDSAVSWLRETDLAVEDVALRLGYADTRAFARAFKRWTGVTPAAFRASPIDPNR